MMFKQFFYCLIIITYIKYTSKQFKLNRTVFVSAGDVIGWTYEGDVGAISFKYVRSHPTHFAQLQIINGRTIFPNLGQTVTFDSLLLPSLYSIAVQVDQCTFYVLKC